MCLTFVCIMVCHKFPVYSPPLWGIRRKGEYMSKNSYTFLIIPRGANSTRKVTVSATFLRVIALCSGILLLCSMYVYYDYLKMKREKIELARLKKLTRDQEAEIQKLAQRVENFSQRMDELSQLDRQLRMLVQHDDRRYKGQVLGMGGSTSGESRIQALSESENQKALSEIQRNVDQLLEDAHSQKTSFSELLSFLKRRKSILAATPSLWPVEGWVTSEFGTRKAPYGGTIEFHKGIDIAARMGTLVIAPADGIVKEVGFDREMGRTVVINHGYGIETLYGHLMNVFVQEGSVVKKGARIGQVGVSGRSTGPHLHYSVMLNSVPVNPRRYLP